MATAKFKGVDQFPAELVETGDRTLDSEILERSMKVVILLEIMNNDWSLNVSPCIFQFSS